MSRSDPTSPASPSRSGPGATRTRTTAEGAASRERLLEAAVATIGERGYTAASLDLLCQRAGVPKTALYWHFGSKDGLLAAVLERVAREWIDEIENSVYQTGEPIERLDRALAGLRRIVDERPRHLRLLLSVLLERCENDEALRATIRDIFLRARTALQNGLADTVGRPLPDLDLIADTILALLTQVALQQLTAVGPVDLERHFQHVRRTTILAIGDQLRRAGLVPPRHAAADGGDEAV